MTAHHASFVIAAVLATQVFAPNVFAQPQSKLLGVPFGQKLALAQCPPNTNKAKSPCWIDKPFFYKPTGSKSGYVHLPNADDRPEWAAHAMFQLNQDKDGRVQEIKVNTSNSRNRYQISEPISKRFGKPIEDELRRTDVSWAFWRSAEGYVELRCKDECWIEFRTTEAQSAREAELAERARVNSSRPKAP